jgi:hypothetical protein
MSPSINKPFINQMVDKFYEYMGQVFIEYYQLPEKPKIPLAAKLSKNISGIEGQPDVDPEVAPLEVEPQEQSFQQYFLYKLYYNYGIKRRMINDHIALLFYAKNLKGYKTGDYITMLCRHMMLDLRSMRIISLGIPKAMKLDAFCEMQEINKEDAMTNVIDDGTVKYQVFKFPEGTMMTYNPSLAKYNVDTSLNTGNMIAEGDNDVEQEGEVKAND